MWFVFHVAGGTGAGRGGVHTYGCASVPHWLVFFLSGAMNWEVVMRLQENRAAARFRSGLGGSQNNLHANTGTNRWLVFTPSHQKKLNKNVLASRRKDIM